MLFQKVGARAARAILLAVLFLGMLSGDRVEAGVKVTYSVDVKQESAAFAIVIAPKLAALQADFDRRRRTEDPLTLLNSTEEALLGILGAPELAAMQDAVKVEFRRARAELPGSRSGSHPGDLRHRVVPAAFRQSPSPAADSPALDRIARLLAKLTGAAEKQEIARDVCVLSKPRARARVQLYPPSYPRGKQEAQTEGKLTLYLGLYAWEAKLRGRIECKPDGAGLAPPACAFLDLLTNDQSIILCDFDLKSCVLGHGPVPAGCQ
ncbi:MAG: hypothetical protein ABUT39_12425 [Acidobacteriota bacterium]